MVECWSIDGVTYCPVKKSDGAFVRYSDYAVLKAENARLKARLAEALKALEEIGNGCDGRVDKDALPCRIARRVREGGEANG